MYALWLCMGLYVAARAYSMTTSWDVILGWSVRSDIGLVCTGGRHGPVGGISVVIYGQAHRSGFWGCVHDLTLQQSGYFLSLLVQDK